MPSPPRNTQVDRAPLQRFWTWLDRPLSGTWCFLGWLASTALFVGFVALLGGPSNGDSEQTLGPTTAIAHGQLACALPRSGASAAPLYPLVSGAVASTTRIGHSVAFPSGAALGPACAKAQSAFHAWLVSADALSDTLRIGYVTWIALLAGIVALLRASGRGRRVWEPLTLIVVACLPPVWMPIQEYFHPQDLLAMGLVLASLACARRDAWIGSGAFIALAVLSQQFALLVAVPLLVVVPVRRRVHFVLAAVVSAVAVTLPLLIASSYHLAGSVFMGTGDNLINDDTMVSALRLGGARLFFVARITPLVFVLIVAALIVHRLGRTAAREPVALMSLVALSLALRLVFEPEVFGYYVMALSVALILLDVICGHIRSVLIVWLLALSLAFAADPTTLIFSRVSWGHTAQHALPAIVLILAVVGIVFTVASRGLHWDLLAWSALAICAGIAWSWPITIFLHPLTFTFEQIVLVVPGVALAAVPLVGRLRTAGETPLAGTRPLEVQITSLD